MADVTRRHGTPNRAELAEWERSAFTLLRAHRDATTPFDDLLPEDPLDHRDELRSALTLLGSP